MERRAELSLRNVCVHIKNHYQKVLQEKKIFSCYHIMSILQLIANADCKRRTTVHSSLVYIAE